MEACQGSGRRNCQVIGVGSAASARLEAEFLAVLLP